MAQKNSNPPPTYARPDPPPNPPRARGVGAGSKAVVVGDTYFVSDPDARCLRVREVLIDGTVIDTFGRRHGPETLFRQAVLGGGQGKEVFWCDPAAVPPPPPPSPPPFKLNADKTVAVATEVYWNEDMDNCPRGVKLQLLGSGGVAIYGEYNGDPFWVGWQAVPRRLPRALRRPR